MSCPQCDQLKHGIRRALQAIFAANVRVAKDELQQVLQTGVAFDAPLDPAHMQSVITWVPVSERLPEKHIDMLVFHYDIEPYSGKLCDPEMVVACCDGEEWTASFGGVDLHRVTHWAELPTPPVGGHR